MTGLIGAPFRAVWKLISGLLSLTGRVLAGIIGLVLLVLGIIFCLTVIGSVVGIPLLILGILLLVRCFF
ncbi:MAG: hypothetical protein JXA64_10295 [Candidatus Fermentibacteraceae bacterium]|nr:hypothetical protein [Candidatus Fermentibacteraceae bacterium]MBN2609491.1 hypothetical protein [Candidatus Fermentibacteraceae bacterium]